MDVPCSLHCELTSVNQLRTKHVNQNVDRKFPSRIRATRGTMLNSHLTCSDLKVMSSSMFDNSWDIDPSEIQICTNAKGEVWSLGCGGFGQVCSALLQTMLLTTTGLVSSHRSMIQYRLTRFQTPDAILLMGRARQG